MNTSAATNAMATNTVSASGTNAPAAKSASTAGVQNLANLAVAVSVPASASAGQDLTYTLSVSNNGPQDAQSVMLSDALPSGLTLVSQEQTSGPTFTLGNSGNSLSDTSATLPAGSTAVISVVAAVSATAANDMALTNRVSASGTNAPSASATTTTEVQNQAALAVTLGAPAAAAAGGNLTYTLTVTNNGPQEAQNVVLSDLLPAGLSFVSQSQTSGPSFQLSNSGNQVSDSIAALAAKASAQVTIIAQVASSESNGTTLTNTLSASAANASGTSAAAATAVQNEASLSASVSGPQEVYVGSTMTYTIALSNSGPEAAQNVSLTDSLPEYLSLVSQTQTGGPTFTLSSQGNNVSDSITSLAADSTAVFEVTVGVSGSTPDWTPVFDTVTASAGNALTDVGVASTLVEHYKLSWDGPQWTWTQVPPPAPTITDPGTQNDAEGDSVSLQVSATAPAGDSLSYAATDLPPGLSIDTSTGVISGTISYSAAEDFGGVYAVTLIVADSQGGSATDTFTWNVSPRVSIDAVDDQSNAVGDSVSLAMSGSDATNANLTWSATGLPAGLSIDATTGVISGQIALGADSSSPYNVVVSADDGVVSASTSFNWAVSHVALVNPGPQESIDGQAISLALQGSDADGDTVTYSVSGLPSGLSLNATTGVISGTLASNADSGGPYEVTVSATDGTNTTTQQFLWTVTQVALVDPGDQANQEGDNVSLQLQGLSDGGTLTYSASGLPDGLSLDPTTGLISGTLAPGDAAAGPYMTTVAVSNGSVSYSQQFNWTVNPVVNLSAPADQSNVEGDSVSLQITASDALNQPLTYSAQGLPAGLSIDASTGLISGTVDTGDAADGGLYAVVVTASDSTYSTSQDFNWTIAPANNQVPTLSNPGNQTNVAGDSVAIALVASDTDNDLVTFNATGLPDGLSIDPNSGLISGVICDDAVSATPYAVTVSADDGNGGVTTQTFNWIVNPSPLVAQLATLSPVEGQNTGAVTVATFTTPDPNSQAGDFVATVNWGDGSSDLATVSGSNGNFSVVDSHTYGDPGSYPLQVLIVDTADGGFASASGSIDVADAPLVLTAGFDEGTIVGQSANLTAATFTDGNLQATASEFTATVDWGNGQGPQAAQVVALGEGVFAVRGTPSYAQTGTYPVSVTVTDVDGAQATGSSSVTVGNVYAGLTATLTVASFTVNDPSAQASDFTAEINWGDGSQSAGTVSGANGSFAVQGTHGYAVDSIDQPGGTYAVSVTVTNAKEGTTLAGSGSVVVVRPPVVLEVGQVAAKPGEALTGVEVAAFADPNWSDGSGEYAATIAWGDGTASLGTVVGSNGVFGVLGNHTYAAAGTYPIEVELSQGWNTFYLFALGVLPAQAPAPPPAPAAQLLPRVGIDKTKDYKPLTGRGGGFYWPVTWKLEKAGDGGRDQGSDQANLIIQHVVIELDLANLKGDRLTLGQLFPESVYKSFKENGFVRDDYTLDYYELWTVAPGGNIAVPSATLPQNIIRATTGIQGFAKTPSSYNDVFQLLRWSTAGYNDNGSAKAPNSTKGSAVMWGEVWYVDAHSQQSAIDDWKFQDYGKTPTPAGGLVARPTSTAGGRPDMNKVLDGLQKANQLSSPVIHYIKVNWAGWNPAKDEFNNTNPVRWWVGPLADLNVKAYEQGGTAAKGTPGFMVPDKAP